MTLFQTTTILLLLAILAIQVYTNFFRKESYAPGEVVEYKSPIQKCGGLQPCCNCWPGEPIYGLGL